MPLSATISNPSALLGQAPTYDVQRIVWCWNDLASSSNIRSGDVVIYDTDLVKTLTGTLVGGTASGANTIVSVPAVITTATAGGVVSVVGVAAPKALGTWDLTSGTASFQGDNWPGQALVPIITFGLARINVTGTVVANDALVTSGTAGLAESDATPALGQVVGFAAEASGAGITVQSVNNIRAWIKLC